MLVSCVYCGKAGRLGPLWRGKKKKSVLDWLTGRIEVTPTLFPLLVNLVHVTCETLPDRAEPKKMINCDWVYALHTCLLKPRY